LPLTQELLSEKKFQNVAAFQVNYDTQKGFLREHGVRWQTTLIVFKGKKEVGRSTADLDKNSIQSLFEKGL
jgi:hypothetical protein